ncbi:DUF4040 domain-containing protein [Hellea balneolensis]|uniref:DUF4040 domain-containing protein n=1 Tax=Hellea balneolensis TaxID=287478 RepID=UPI0003FEF160|nr:DUF4040 domain-containing protein [Hellea balneolensis]
MIMASSFVPSVLILDLAFMAILVVVAFSIVRMRSLFAIVMLQGVYSLVCAAWFVSLDAVDVAFTEAAVGAGVSTVLMLAAMLLADRKSEPVPVSKQIAPLIVVIVAGLAMFYAIGDMPAFGDVNSPANSGPGMDYVDRTTEEIHIPNVVTAVLASYRGYDTFGEAVVIFAAGLGVLLLLGLNGNAGRWTASPNGQRISAPAAPSAATPKPALKQTPPRPSAPLKGPLREEEREPSAALVSAPEPVKGPIVETAKTNTKPTAKRKAPAKGKTDAKPKAATAKTTKSSTKAAPKKRGRPAGSKNKPKTTAKKTTAKKITDKTAPKSTPKKRGRPKGSKNKPKTGGTS